MSKNKLETTAIIGVCILLAGLLTALLSPLIFVLIKFVEVVYSLTLMLKEPTPEQIKQVCEWAEIKDLIDWEYEAWREDSEWFNAYYHHKNSNELEVADDGSVSEVCN